MDTYTITAHIEFPNPSGPIQTTAIRMNIPADSELEAKAKAERFIQAKLTVVVDSCALKKPESTLTADAKLAEVANMFREVFGESFGKM